MLKNKKDKTCLLIEMIVPLDTNTSVKTTEKLSKYKYLEIEVERMCGLKTTTVPLVMGAFGTIKKDMKNYSYTIPGNINIHERSGGSSPSSRNPLCLPKSMVWTRMLREKINRNYISISYIIMIIIIIIMVIIIIIII